MSTAVITKMVGSAIITNLKTGSVVVTKTPAPVTIISRLGQPGGKGDPGVAGVIVHPVTVPAATWTVTHTLGRYPIVQLIDTAGVEFDADVEMPDLATVVVTHAQPIAGSVLLS